MKFSNLGKGSIETIVTSQNPTQFHLDNLWYDVERGRLVATNGTSLVVAHVIVEAGDVTGYIQPKVIAHYRKTLAKNKHFDASVTLIAGKNECTVTDHMEGLKTEFRRPVNETRFPNYEAVLPKCDGAPLMCFSLSRLVAVVKAIGIPDTDSQDDTVCIWPNPSPDKPYLVKTSREGALGIVMPMRVEPGEWLTTVDAIEQRLYGKPIKAKATRKHAEVATMPAPKPEVTNATTTTTGAA